MKKTTKKVLALGSGAVLLVSASVMGTMAYLSSKTETVTNTFTVGNVGFDNDSALDEAKVDQYGVKTGEERVTGNKYKLVPNHRYVKDPTVHISDTSEDCWLFVKVDNGISGIEADNDGDDTIHEQMMKLEWTPIEEGSSIYYYKTTVRGGADVPVFKEFTIDEEADVAAYAYAKIEIQAYAIQADGFEEALDAWETAPLTDWQ